MDRQTDGLTQWIDGRIKQTKKCNKDTEFEKKKLSS